MMLKKYSIVQARIDDSCYKELKDRKYLILDIYEGNPYDLQPKLIVLANNYDTVYPVAHLYAHRFNIVSEAS